MSASAGKNSVLADHLARKREQLRAQLAKARKRGDWFNAERLLLEIDLTTGQLRQLGYE